MITLRPFRTASSYLVVAALFFVASCGAVVNDDGDEASSDDPHGLPSDVVSKGTLTIAIGTANPPMNFEDDKGEPAGFNVDIAEAMTEELGVDLEVVQVPFDGVLAGIESGRYDSAIYNIASTDERRTVHTYVEYAKSAPVLITSVGNPKGLMNTLEGLCGSSMAAIAGSAQLTVLEETNSTECTAEKGKDPITIDRYQDQGTLKLAVATRRNDGFLASGPYANYIVSEQSGELELVGPIDSKAGNLGMPVRKDRTELAEALFSAWKVLLEDGTYGEVANEWGVETIMPAKITLDGSDGP